MLKAGPFWLGYHGLVLFALFKSLKPYFRPTNEKPSFHFAILAIASLIIAWHHIYSYIYLEFLSRENLDDFLKGSDIFVGAYRAVVVNPFGWWFSWQLLAWSCVIVLRIAEANEAEGWKRASEYRWLVLLGFFGAMSTCGALFFGRTDEKSTCEYASCYLAVL